MEWKEINIPITDNRSQLLYVPKEGKCNSMFANITIVSSFTLI